VIWVDEAALTGTFFAFLFQQAEKLCGGYKLNDHCCPLSIFCWVCFKTNLPLFVFIIDNVIEALIIGKQSD
jgi:hypothetical protein